MLNFLGMTLKFFLVGLECIPWSGRPKFSSACTSKKNYKRLKKTKKTRIVFYPTDYGRIWPKFWKKVFGRSFDTVVLKSGQILVQKPKMTNLDNFEVKCIEKLQNFTPKSQILKRKAVYPDLLFPDMAEKKQKIFWGMFWVCSFVKWRIFWKKMKNDAKIGIFVWLYGLFLPIFSYFLDF